MKHPMARILSSGILIISLFGNSIIVTAKTPTVSVENGTVNEQVSTQSTLTHTSIGNGKILKSALIGGTVIEEESEEENFNKKGYTTTSVNVRSKPSKDSKKLDTYKINTKIKYRNYNDEWVKIKYDDDVAYIAKDYVSNKKTKVKKNTYEYSGTKLTRSRGVNQGPSGKETYYNLPMQGVVRIMRSQGYNYNYWVRSDGCKMFGDYIMVAADLSIRPRGSLVPTSLGMGIVCDTGTFIYSNRTQLDLAVTW